jgi:acyl transferase domain-containing protein/NADPH:quinone reductase-like Zn-dependent oxidoreductase/acyl carrier protein
MKDNDRGFSIGADDPIAIVGMACNLPGDNRDPEAFFDFLLKKKCGIVEIPSDRWGADTFYDPNPNAMAKSVSKWAGFIEDVRGFDAKFFGISPREAAGMDPQQRLVLQGAVDAMMDAQIPFEEFSAQCTGVFLGISQSEYRTVQEMRLTGTENYAGTGYALCIAANRVSHRLNLTGPSFAVDTACSSSLTALDQAVKNLRAGACDMALVGGVNAISHPSSFLAFSRAGMLSATGRISTFDVAANGFVRGEGMGMIVIKSLRRAQADGDRIHAVLHATATNQDGSTNTITAPSQKAQTAMLRSLFENVDVSPGQVGFVEAHGTGTPIGDPIEAGSVGVVIGQNSADHPVFIGSSKANIGHLESGAGIAGLIKAAMAVKSGIVPPNIHFKNPNPDIPFDALNLAVPVKSEAFPETGGPNVAVVNSFGFGGANACALLSSAPVETYNHHPISLGQKPTAGLETGEAGFAYIFPLSGATQEALAENAAALLRAVQGKGKLAGTALADLAASLATKRSHLMYRAVILARKDADLRSGLRALARGKPETAGVITGQMKPDTSLCFTFSGQGSQWWGMARDLLVRNATFAGAVDAFDAEFTPVAGWSIRAELLKDQAVSRIDDTTVTQPALFAIQSGLAALWKQFGVEPDMVMGHSIGEAAASYLANGLSLSGAAKFLSKRGAIRDQLGAKGAMAAIGMNHADIEPILPANGSLGIAAINGPGSTTISGDFDALHDFVEEFQIIRPDTFIRVLTVDTAWHSHHLDAGEEWFRSEMAAIDWSVPTLPFISTVTGQPETRFDTDYAWLNLRRPVLFQEAIQTAIELGATTFLELGPAATLAGPTKSTALEMGASVSVLGSINRKDNDFDTFARAAAQLFVQGVPLDWSAITGTPTAHVELPQNVWIKEQFWNDSEESRDAMYGPGHHPFLGKPERGNGASWMAEFSLHDFPYLKDHRMQSDVIFPAAGYIDTMIAAARRQFGANKAVEVEDAIIHEALFIATDEEVLFSTIYDAERSRIKLYSRIRDSDEDWILRCESKLRMFDVPPPQSKPTDWSAKSFKDVGISYVYDVDASQGLINYGDAFQTITQLRMSRTKTLARVALQDAGQPTQARHHLHPTIFDGCLQILDPRMSLKKVATGRQNGDPVCLPVGLGRMRLYADLPDEVIVEATQFKSLNDDTAVGCDVFDLDGKLLMTVEDVRVTYLPAKSAEKTNEEEIARFVRQDLIELRDFPLSETAKGSWIVLDFGEADDANLPNSLASMGVDVQRIARSELEDDPGGVLVDLLGDQIEAGKVKGILVTWPLSLPQLNADSETDNIFTPLERLIKDLISLGELMDYARTGTEGLPEFVFLTCGAYPDSYGNASGAAILSQMPVAALARGLATEAPEYKLRVIDADAKMRATPAKLAAHILTQAAESELVLRDDKCFAPRLHLTQADDYEPQWLSVAQEDKATNFHATMDTPGVIDNVALAEIPLVDLSDDKVRVRIRSVGLNFRDIMAVTGLLPVEAEPEPAWQNLGLEFGGVIEAVGSSVTNFKPGDRVMGLGKHCLQKFISIDPRALMLVPDHITLAQAATIPSAFATAHYALNHTGRMRKGDKVFIHVATGGVGTAAVQLAQAAGAEIFATAGNPAKRRLLHELGVPHVMDSRSLKFADDVMRITNGTGVDVLLNSLPGDYITKGLDIMAPYGRFLEIGKRDVYEDAAIGMKALRRNISLSVLDLAAMGQERPDLMADLFAELAQMVQNKSITPLPLTEFPVSQISDAIRYMSQAKHVGKVVVSLDEKISQVRRDRNRPVTLSPDASYLVTGGTGGFSLGVADWLSRAGAGELILASRSGVVGKADQKRVSAMRKRGTHVKIASLDITNAQAVNNFVQSAQAGERPLKGIVHGAAVIKDGFANQLSDEMINQVLEPKIKGGWNLHRACAMADISLDFMIGFSSIAQAIGSAGQTNYIAGNAFLDALAHYRRSRGERATAIDWGVVGDAGFVARNTALASYLESMGLFGLSLPEADLAMAHAISRDAPAFVYARADWGLVARANPALGPSPRLSSVLQNESGGATEVRSHLLSLTGDALLVATEEFIKDEITSVLKIDKNIIQPERPMSELGLDSLSSFELKIRLETALDCSIPVSKFLQAPTVKELALTLSNEIEAIRRNEAATGTAAIEHGGQAGPRNGAFASDLQLGLLRDATSKMTSDLARAAMEHRAEIQLPETCDTAQLSRILRKTERRHPMLTLRIDDTGQIHLDGPGLALGQSPANDLLNVAHGEFLRASLTLKEGAPVLNLRLHHIVGDATSLDLLRQEILASVQGATLAKPLPKKAVLGAVSAARFDPENPQARHDRAFWSYALGTAITTPVPFKQRSRALLPPSAGRNHGPAASLDYTLPEHVETGRLLCAFAAALREATHSTGSVIIGKKVTRRTALPAAPTIGPFDIEQPLLVPAGNTDPIQIAQFLRILAAADAHPGFDSFAAATELSPYFAQGGATPFQILFEPVSKIATPAPKVMLHDLWLQVEATGKQTRLRLIYDRDILDAALAQTIGNGIVQALNQVEMV